MSVNNEPHSVQGRTAVLDKISRHSVCVSLFEKINLTPVKNLSDITDYQDTNSMADASADRRVAAAIQVLMRVITQSGQKLDKNLLDQHIAERVSQMAKAKV